MRKLLLCCVVVSLSALPIAAQARAAWQTQDGALQAHPSTADSDRGQGYETIAYPNTFATYQLRLESLNAETLTQRDRDGGRLTPEHAADFQARLDRLNHIYGVDRLNEHAYSRR